MYVYCVHSVHNMYSLSVGVSNPKIYGYSVTKSMYLLVIANIVIHESIKIRDKTILNRRNPFLRLNCVPSSNGKNPSTSISARKGKENETINIKHHVTNSIK